MRRKTHDFVKFFKMGSLEIEAKCKT
jgi:hypothetical protein